MKYIKAIIKSRGLYSVAISVLVSVFVVTVVVSAATTISTNIETGGTLSVTGATTLTGTATLTGGFLATGSSTALANLTTASTFQASSTSLFGDTLTVKSGKGLVLGTSASEITGSEGMIFYDSASKVIKMHDGSNWFTVGTTTSGLTLSAPRLQLANLTYYMTFGTTTQEGLSVMTLGATTTASIPLTIIGKTGQTANLLQLLNSAETELFAIDNNGNASTSVISTTGDLYVNGNATTTGSSGNVATRGTLTVAGASTLNGAVTLGDAASDAVTLTGNASTTNSLTVGNDLYVSGRATTTGSSGNIETRGSLTVGNGRAMATMIFGICNISATTINASTTGFADCVDPAARGIVAGDTVFVQATSTLPASFEIQAASSTAANTINLRINNTGMYGDGNSTGARGINFWVVR